MKPVSDGGKKDSPRKSSNVKRPYREVDIDWSKDAKGKPRINRQGTKAMPNACEEFAGGIAEVEL